MATTPSRPVSRAPDPLIGREVARCRLESYVAGGGTAVVYLGTHLGLGKPVAVKILRPQAAAMPSVVESFRREAQAIARVDSENVLKVYDVVSEGNLPCMVMELLEGESVLELITARGRLSQIESLRIVRQAAEGLAAVHARGIIHRDVKPQNLVVRPDGTVKLVDFGLAIEAEAGSKRVGTPHYVAPETCATGHADAASDIYSLGVTLFHLLVGQPPYAGRPVQEVLRAHIQADDMGLEGRRPGLARPVIELFRRLTQNDPDQRPSAAQVVDMIDRVGGSKLRRKQSLRRLRRPSTLVPVLVGAACLAAAGGITFLLMSGDGDPAKERAAAPTTTPSPAAPEPVPSVIDAEPPKPRAPVETVAEKALREGLEQEAQVLLDRAEAWAREKWVSREDTEEVVKRYGRIVGIYRKTPAAREARRRAKEIEDGVRHPHPDRRWSTPEEIKAATKGLEAAGAPIADLVSKYRYREAQALLPPRVSDPSGEMEARLAYEHALLHALAGFPQALMTHLRTSADDVRAIDTARGQGTLEGMTEDAFTVRIDGSVVEVPWADVAPGAVARLAMPLFENAPQSDLIPFLAFCVAHGLGDAFWEATMSVDLGMGRSAEADLIRVFQSRMGNR